jgi:hypothetical protein
MLVHGTFETLPTGWRTRKRCMTPCRLPSTQWSVPRIWVTDLATCGGGKVRSGHVHSHVPNHCL